jgi:hypothetical protein
MPHESLERPCVDATARQGVAGGMPQHVAWIGKGSLAASPSRSMSFCAPSTDRGTLRSDKNTKSA